jgi:hypothetical protein
MTLPTMENSIEIDEDMRATVMASFTNLQQLTHKHLCAVVAAMAEVLRRPAVFADRPTSPTPCFL